MALKEGLTSPLFAPALKLGRLMRPFLPGSLKNKVPQAAGRHAHLWPTRRHERKVLMLAGCVQPAMMPNINSATARVLDAVGIQTLVADEAGCCGAIRTHLNDHEGGLADMRRNIDAWWPLVMRNEVEAIVMNASGCGVTVKEYGHYLQHDKEYAEKARRIGELTKDLSELLPELAAEAQAAPEAVARPHAGPPPPGRSAWYSTRHARCSTASNCAAASRRRCASWASTSSCATGESHLCCGSAGTYSVLQPELAYQLRDRKLAQLLPRQPQAIISANIGCIQHLQTGTTTPVRHWVEVLDEALGV